MKQPRQGWPALAHACAAAVATMAVGLGSAKAQEAPSAAPPPVQHSVIERLAAERAARPFEPRPEVPEALRELGYDAFRDLRFRPDRAIWRDEKLPFQLQMFHPGSIFPRPVKLELIDGERGRREVEFSPSFFEYGPQREKIAAALADVHGFAGLRVHHPLNRPDYFDELVAFLGASYFRALGSGQQYGLSARGLAINPGEAEEFPAFVHFIVERPERGARELVILALLDGPSVTGGYTMIVRPGSDTVMEVHATIYLRNGHKVTTLGVAPLTSMFWHGENSGTTNGDFRPEVHDSDGFALALEGEHLWRPLTNPRGVRLMSFSATAPRGFGLMQRDRDFDHYLDLETRYERRPSAWVEPLGDWGAGAVRLVELPAGQETQDNIVACWVPATLPEPGQPLRVAYRLHWFMEGHGGPELPPGWVKSTRRGDFVLNHAGHRQFVIEFDAAGLTPPREGGMLPEPDVSVGAGAKLVYQLVQPNRLLDSWRLTLNLAADHTGGEPIELRAALRLPDGRVSETWSHLWQP